MHDRIALGMRAILRPFEPKIVKNNKNVESLQKFLGSCKKMSMLYEFHLTSDS